MNKTKNKILIALAITLTILSTLFVSNIFATDSGKVTPEETTTIESAEHDPAHEVNGGRYITMADLANFYDYFCCYHGGVDSKLPGVKDVTLTTEQGSTEEPYLTYKDIGKKNFEVTLDGENTETPFKEGTYQNYTYGMFKVQSSEICGPKEAYILSEMMYNMPYPSYVQNAWWTTEAGSKGAIPVAPNDLTIEAEAFEAYILEAAGVSSVDELGKNTVINYTFNGQEKSLDCGFDIKYEPKYNEDSNQDGKIEREEEGADRPTVAWDSDEQVYKIGPFSIDYIESKIKAGERAEVMFAGITDAKLYTDASEEPLERGKDWEFLWLHGERDNDDESEFPHKNEVFYIKLNYIEGATKVTDLAFFFEYMNAAGKYEYLDGTYFTATWEADSKDNWCRVSGVHRPHGSGENACDGKSCSHGEYRYHIKSTTYWIELTSLEENKAQLLALGLSAAKVKFKTELHWEGEMPDNSGKLKIQKVVVNKDGEKVDSNARFKFKIYINDKYKETVSVKANSTVIRTYKWGADEDVPTYRVEEVEKEGTELVDIENAKGDLKNGRTVKVKAINQIVDTHKGTLRIDKIVQGNTKDKEYEFKVIIGNDIHNVKISEATGWTWVSPEYTWTDDNAPKYSVQEVNLPEGAKLISLTPSTGYLQDNDSTSQVTVTAINSQDVTTEYEHGKIRITKKLDGNATSADTFKFKITLNGGLIGNKEIYVSLKANQTYESSDFVWLKGTEAPTYKVEEIDIPEGSKLIKIENQSGSLKSNSTAEVIAINELEGKSGKIKVTKEAITDDKQVNETIEGTFTISVKITGTFEMNGESIVNGSRTITNSVRAGESFETPEIKWYGDEAPTYYVTETEMPQGWKLDSISSSNGSLEEGNTIDVTVTNIFTTRVIIDLTMEMAGDVWEDVPLNEDDKNTENSVENGIYDRGQENPIDGVLVNIYRVVYKGNEELYRELATGYLDEEKTPIEFPLMTGEDTEAGHWFAPRMSVPALNPDEQGQGLQAKYDIEFIYDGQTYEPTKFLATSNGDSSAYINATTSERDKWQNDSMALDINREEVDNRIQEVKGDTPIDGTTGMTHGKVVGQNGEQGIDYTSREQTVSDTTTRVSEVITRDENGVALDVFKATARTSQGGLYYPFDNKIHLESIDKGIDELGAYQKYIYSATYGYTQHINLGLKLREDADMFATKDLVSAKVAVNGKVVEYKYNKLLDKLYGGTAENGEVVAIDDTMYFQAKEQIPGYDLKLYDTDYYYRTEIYKDNQELYDDLNAYYQSLGLENIEDRELDVFLKYRIDLYNSSKIYDAEINEVLDYYDDSFELVETEVKKLVQTKTDSGLQEETVVVAEPSTDGNGNSVAWTQTGEKVTDANGKTYKVMSTNALDNVKIKPGEKVTLNVTFKLAKATDSQGVQNAIRMENIDAQKSNIVEISNYSTYYSENGKIAGKIDKDSAPDNVNLGLQKDGNIEGWFEDDTAAAPVLNMGYYERTRNIDGLAWEDKEEEQVKDSAGNETNEYVGNGIYDEGEQLLGGVTTELVEKITVKNIATGKYKEYDYIWPTDKSLDSLGGKTIEQISGFDSTTETGKATDVGKYTFSNVPAGNFVVRFTYGNQDLVTSPNNTKIAVFNGHDYKTTAYQVTVNNKDSNGIINNEWHDLSNEELAKEHVSDARDSETRRLEVIEKSKVITNANGEILATASEKDADHTELYKEYYMYADTAKLNLDIEDLNNTVLKNAIKNNQNNQSNGGISITVLDSDVAVNSLDVTYDIKQIDVGLEERSENKIVLDKQISEIKLEASDKTVLLDAKYDINYTFEEKDNKTVYKANVKLNEASIGIDQLQALNKEEDKDSNPHSGQQNFRYINIEERLLQGATIEMKYKLTALNIGETDLVGEELRKLENAEQIKTEREKLELATTLYDKKEDGTFTRKNAIGKYLGSTYYNGKNNEGNKDVVAEVRVRQLIDYVDNDATFAAIDNMEANNSWRTITEPELLAVKEDGTFDYENRILTMNTEETKGIFTLNEDGTINATVGSILDDKGVKYNTENKSNIIISIDDTYEKEADKLTNKGFTKALVPAVMSDENNAWNSEITLTTTKYFGAETNSKDMTFDNVAEIVKFEGTVGRRDIETTPGNTVPSVGEFKASLEERDTSATELITLTPPTGADVTKVMGIQLILAILAGLLIVAIGIVVIKKKVLNK